MVRARDADGSAPNNHVYYFLETGDRDQFTIDHMTGSITVVDVLDHESVATYSIKVMARDQAADPLHSYCTVHIDVADVNDEPPRFRENHVTVDVTPDLMGAVYNMSAVDLDQNSVLKYFILWTDSYGQSQALGTIPGEDLRVRGEILNINNFILINLLASFLARSFFARDIMIVYSAEDIFIVSLRIYSFFNKIYLMTEA